MTPFFNDYIAHNAPLFLENGIRYNKVPETQNFVRSGDHKLPREGEKENRKSSTIFSASECRNRSNSWESARAEYKNEDLTRPKALLLHLVAVTVQLPL